jgi:Tfp pilus assembly protein PilW
MLTRPGLTTDAGFTLVELLVAMTLSMLVVFAASALMIFGLHSEKRVAGRVQVTSSARIGLEDLVQELDSGCLTDDVSPVQPAATQVSPTVSSDASNLVFVSGLSDSRTPTATEHVVSVKNQSLVDTAYPSTGGGPGSIGSPATWTFSPTPSQTQTLIQNVAQDGTTPIFQYFSYANPSNPNPDSLLDAQPLTLPLGQNAAQVAEVGIDLVAEPAQSEDDAAESATLTDAVTFRFSAAASPSADPNAQAYPCD